MLAAEKQTYLDAVDAVLAGMGFKRPRRSQEWSRRDGNDRLWGHLNFGLCGIQLTIGVEYWDVRKAWGDLPGGIFSASESPQTDWSSVHAPTLVADYVRSVVSARHPELRDRDAVIERLLSLDVRSWPTFSFSHRIRLLPVLMISRGQPAQALEFCRGIPSADLARDQLLPSFVEFRGALEARLANSTQEPTSRDQSNRES